LSIKERNRLQNENLRKFGLPRSFYSKIELPRPTDIKVFELKDIVDCKRNITTAERIQMLEDIKKYSHWKLENIKTILMESQNEKVYQLQAPKPHERQELLNELLKEIEAEGFSYKEFEEGTENNLE